MPICHSKTDSFNCVYCNCTENGSDISDGVDYDALESTAGVSQKLVELKSGDWFLNVAPWIGGRIINMIHTPTGKEFVSTRLLQYLAWVGFYLALQYTTQKRIGEQTLFWLVMFLGMKDVML